jgi:hypothetical protein
VIVAESFFGESGVSSTENRENTKKARRLRRSLGTQSGRCLVVIIPLCD